MKMLSKPCYGCPFTSSSLVSPDRVKEIVEELTATDQHFICHKASDEIGVERLKGTELMCRGYYDKLFLKSGVGQLTRILARLGGFEIVKLSAMEQRVARASIKPWREGRKW